MSSEFQPSVYQSAIFDWVSNGTGNAIINAVAGSGKTTTLVEASKLIDSDNVLFAAFNTHIVGTLRSRLPKKTICRTMHSIGRECLLKHLGLTTIKPISNKYRAYCRTIAKSIHEQLETIYDNKLKAFDFNSDVDLPDAPPLVEEIRNQLQTLTDFCRTTLADPESLEELENLAEHFSIDCPVPLPKIKDYVKHILDMGESDALESNTIDFTDMLWLTFKWNLKPPKFHWVLIDEAQDLNASQLHLVNKMVGENTRLLFVGDPKQAIYGFSGADSNAFSNIKVKTNAQEFPLSICYRCPAKIVGLAKTIVEQIEPRPGCIDGEITEIKEDAILSHVKDGDLILCRSTAPLVKLCFKLLSNKKQARIKGKDIGKALIKIVKDVEAEDGFDFTQFLDFLEKIKIERINKLNQKPDNEQQVEDFIDQVESIAACFVSYNCKSAPEFRAELDNLFSDESTVITLSTIHKTKGLEEDRVFILHYEKMPLKWKKQKDWQFTQENNLKYVAITRTKQHLYLVSEVQEA
ncbi:MAG: ATP-dependent helicase [Chitinophagales bacterium]|nr:ATP-dependent helicase [Chitinophagales bacterium]